MSSEVEDFLAEVVPQQTEADRALHQGDPEPRLALWSRADPVTVFGAKRSAAGWNDVSALFHDVATWFSDSTKFEFEVIAAGASGDLAYTVGYEHDRTKVAGAAARDYTLRVTHVYRRERGTWRIVHRHADFAPDDSMDTWG